MAALYNYSPTFSDGIFQETLLSELYEVRCINASVEIMWGYYIWQPQRVPTRRTIYKAV